MALVVFCFVDNLDEVDFFGGILAFLGVLGAPPFLARNSNESPTSDKQTRIEHSQFQ